MTEYIKENHPEWNVGTPYDNDMIRLTRPTYTSIYVFAHTRPTYTSIYVFAHTGIINVQYPQAGIRYDKTFKCNDTNILQITEEIIAAAKKLRIVGMNT